MLRYLIAPLLLIAFAGRAADPLGAQRDADPYAGRRAAMVRTQIESRGVKDPRVLDAMHAVPRHEFVPERLAPRAYDDGPLPIGNGQTISQPFVVAFMTEALRPEPSDVVLEIGTGSGYQAAVLSTLVREVFSIEIVPALADRARATLSRLGYRNVHVRTGDGYAGWPERAPFSKIVVTAAPPEIPKALVDQLAVGGSMVLPVGSFWQELTIVRKTPSGITREQVMPVRFVPMVKPPAR
jgi:protein-L-isoaspartate(D-aspartate) O-methyltransferase